jgi:hypothetical protein
MAYYFKKCVLTSLCLLFLLSFFGCISITYSGDETEEESHTILSSPLDSSEDSINSTVMKNEEDSFGNNNTEEELQVLLSIPYNIVNISESKTAILGPESFFISEDNHVYILDTGNYKIHIFYDGNIVDTIKIKIDEGDMIDFVVDENNIYILLKNNYNILKIDYKGNILDVLKSNGVPRYIDYEDGALKVWSQNYNVQNLTDTNASVEKRNVGASRDGFNTVLSEGHEIKFPSYGTPSCIYKEKSVSDYDIYYTSETINIGYKIVFDRRLYYVSSGSIQKYVQLEQPQYFKPNRLYRIMQDGTVCQMMPFEDKLDIVKLGFLTDYSEQYVPSYLDIANDY